MAVCAEYAKIPKKEKRKNTSQIFPEVNKHVFENRGEENMELFVVSPNLRFTNITVAPGSTVSDLIDHFAVKEVSDQ